jgi:DNA-binding MarR family transcriptional regulator
VGHRAGGENQRAISNQQVVVDLSRRLGPGPATIEGLRWLARAGPAPIDAWACAMGWATPTAKSHAARLARERWIERVPRRARERSLLFATRQGVQIAGVDVPPSPVPAPIW